MGRDAGARRVTEPAFAMKRPFWETPRNIAALLALVAAIFCVLGYQAGRKFGQTSPSIIINLPPQASQK